MEGVGLRDGNGGDVGGMDRGEIHCIVVEKWSNLAYIIYLEEKDD